MPGVSDLPLYHNAEVSISAWKDKLQDAKTEERRQKCIDKLRKWNAILIAVKAGYVRPPKPSRPKAPKPPPLPKPPKEKKVKVPKPPREKKVKEPRVRVPKPPRTTRPPPPPKLPKPVALPAAVIANWVPAPLRWD